jgi:hypothetical protein
LRAERAHSSALAVAAKLTRFGRLHNP